MMTLIEKYQTYREASKALNSKVMHTCLDRPSMVKAAKLLGIERRGVLNIQNDGELTDFMENKIHLLKLETKYNEPIKYLIPELVRNVLEHAQCDTGAILSAEYSLKSNTVRLGIADTGLGIKKGIGFSHATPDHLTAIRLALIPGITGTTRREGGTAFNAGAGLFFIKSIAKVNRDFFVMYSGDALYKLLKSKTKKIRLFGDPFHDHHSTSNELPFWQGTIVGIDISLDRVEEFSEILEHIHKAYLKTMKDRKKARYRRPRFE